MKAIKAPFPLFVSSYYVIYFDLEIFYQQLYKTQWWGAINEIVNNLRLKRLPLTEAQLHEQFKKKFGFKKAMKCKVFRYHTTLCDKFQITIRPRPAFSPGWKA